MSSGPTPSTDADRIAAVVLSCSSVAGLHGGRWGEVATYLPGRQVAGVRVHPDLVEVHVVGVYPTPVADIARQVRTALHPETGETPIQIVVENYADPADEQPQNAGRIAVAGPDDTAPVSSPR